MKMMEEAIVASAPMQEPEDEDTEAVACVMVTLTVVAFLCPCCRHTLWKRVQGVVTPFLASMISYMDRDGNLELLAQPDSPAWAQDLWMFIFRDIKFLNIPLVVTDTR